MPGHFVYGLFDPRNGELRYIGFHVGVLQKRLREHLCHARKGKKLYVYDWMRQVLTAGCDPEIHVFQEFDTAPEMVAAEVYWVRFFREAGCRLTNLTDGGEGCFGYRHTSEAKKKMSEAKRGKPRSMAFRRARSPLTLEQEGAVVRWYAERISCADIGKRIGMGLGGVRKVLLRNGVKLRSPWAPTSMRRGVKPKLSSGQIQEIVRRYEAGDSASVICRDFGVCDWTVRAAIRRAGVSMRLLGRPVRG